MTFEKKHSSHPPFPTGQPPTRGLLHDLEHVLEIAQGRPMTLREIEDCLAGRGAGAMIALLCLPFLTPIPLPGFSVLVGLVIGFLAVGLVRGKGRLPGFLGRREVAYSTLEKLVSGGRRVHARVARLFKPRFTWFFTGRGRYCAGACIWIAAFALSLPIPPVIPFTNAIPAFAILFIALGFIEEDGLFVLMGNIGSLLSWVYLIVWWEIVERGIRALVDRFL